jgi:hypothetical protein
MRYAHKLDTIAEITDHLLVPHYMSLVALLPLLLTSKQLRNKINARDCIAQYIRATIGIPVDRMRYATKIRTFFLIRGGKQIPYNLLTEYGLAMKDACIICLKHAYVTCRARREGKCNDCELLFTNGIDECRACKTEPSWIVRGKCTHPSHWHLDDRKKLHGQCVCAKCLMQV